MNYRLVLASVALAFTLTLVGSSVPRRVTVAYPDIMGCEAGCEVAASGFPFAFIADYPGLSPVNSADLMGALLRLDRVLWPQAAAAFGFWFAVALAAVWGVFRVVRARRAA